MKLARCFFLLSVLYSLTGISIAQETTLEQYLDSAEQFLVSGNFIEARQSALFGTEVALQNGDVPGEAECYNLLSSIGEYEGNFDDMLYYAWLSDRTLRPTGDSIAIARASLNLGEVYTFVGDYDLALQHLLESRRIFESSKDSIWLAYNNNGLANFYSMTENYTKASELYSSAAHFFKVRNDTINESICLTNAGFNYIELNDYKAAEVQLQRSLDLKSSLGEFRGVLYGWIDMLHLYNEMGATDKASAYYQKAYAVQDTMGDFSRHWMLLEFSVFNKLTGQLNLAKNQIDQAVILVRETGDQPGLLEILEERISLHRLQREFEFLAEDLTEVQQLKDSILSREKQEKILKLDALYNLKEKEQEIELLSASDQLNKEKLLAERLRVRELYIIIFIVVLVVIGIAWFFWRSRKLNAFLVNKNLELLRVENRLKADLSSARSAITDSPPPQEKEAKYAESSLTDDRKEEIYTQLNQVLIENNAYLDQNLTLSTLAKKMKVNRVYLSQVINEKFDQNYNSLINDLRIKSACQMLSESDALKYTIEHIGNRSGFKSVSSFNKIFKQITGVTASEFRKQAQHIQQNRK